MGKDKEEKYIMLIHRDADVNTLTQFMNKEHIYNIEPKDLFELNRDYIWSQMSIEDFKSYSPALKNSSELSFDDNLPRPCNLKIPAKNLLKEVIITQTNVQTNDTSFNVFNNDNIQKIINSPTLSASNQNGSYTKIKQDLTVLGWFKANGFSRQLKNKIDANLFTDLSDLITSVNTHSDKNGGNFSFRLPYIPLDEKSEDQLQFVLFDSNQDSPINKKIKANFKFDYGKGDYNSNFDFFSSLIQNNDLIFIKFDSCDFSYRTSNATGFGSYTLDQSVDLSKEEFDMIGLVDTISVVKTAATADSYIEVKGRDLIKLLIDDSSNFFQIATTPTPEDIFCNVKTSGDASSVDYTNLGVNDNSQAVRRLLGEIDIFSNRVNMSVSYILKGVISQLTNIEVTNGNLFEKWGDNRTKITEFK